jgi:hypothetical protein
MNVNAIFNAIAIQSKAFRHNKISQNGFKTKVLIKAKFKCNIKTHRNQITISSNNTVSVIYYLNLKLKVS